MRLSRTAVPPEPPEIDDAFVALGRSRVATVDAGDELLAVDERTAALHRLNGTAAAVWACCDGAPVGEIARDLAEIFSAPLEVVLPDVRRTVQSLAQLDLLELGDGDDEPGAAHGWGDLPGDPTVDVLDTPHGPRRYLLAPPST
ncbi:MAG: PqqD family protein [Acidimicrobiales bacterium]|nr:PqqD family protein [Acidimicrobiales bacterium]